MESGAGKFDVHPMNDRRSKPVVSSWMTKAILFLFLFRRKRKQGGPQPATPPPGVTPPPGDGAPAGGGSGDSRAKPPGQSGSALPGPPLKPGMKGDAAPRPRPMRKDYNGVRLKVYVHGRMAEDAGNASTTKAGPGARGPRTAEPRTAEGRLGEEDRGTLAPRSPGQGPGGSRPAEGPSPPPAGCPSCSGPTESPGRPCTACEAKERVLGLENLLSALKARGVNVLPAERYFFQARSAQALNDLKDVEFLCGRGEAMAREQEADFEECQKLLARCEEAISSAIDSGKNTLAAEKVFRRAAGFFKEGRYPEAMEEAVVVPSLILDRPGRPRIVPTGRPLAPGPSPPEPAHPGGKMPPPAASLGEDPPHSVEPVGEGPATPAASAEKDLAASPHGAGSATKAPPAAASGRADCEAERPASEPAGSPQSSLCVSCGEWMDKDWSACPNCGRLQVAGAALEGGPGCPRCGGPVEPAAAVCPACNASLVEKAGEGTGKCPSCGKDVLPAWTICPYCDGGIPGPAKEDSTPRRVLRVERKGMPAPSAQREKGLFAQIEGIVGMLEEAERRGTEVRKAQSLLELAINFTRAGNYDKGERYVRKAKNVAETILSLSQNGTKP